MSFLHIANCFVDRHLPILKMLGVKMFGLMLMEWNEFDGIMNYNWYPVDPFRTIIQCLQSSSQRHGEYFAQLFSWIDVCVDQSITANSLPFVQNQCHRSNYSHLRLCSHCNSTTITSSGILRTISHHRIYGNIRSLLLILEDLLAQTLKYCSIFRELFFTDFHLDKCKVTYSQLIFLSVVISNKKQ